ncbi:MAG: alpha/beta fold hydrolase [Blautia sp.]|nr:alpha/beta fold hydrolase [Blautia sp.]
MKKVILFVGLTVSMLLGTCVFAEEIREVVNEAVEEDGKDLEEIELSQYEALAIEIPGPYEIETTRISVPSNGVSLDAILTVPVTEEEKYPMVILTHGFMADYYDTENMAVALGKNGFASIRMSLEGSGESGGEYQDTTFTTQKEDVINVLHYAKTLDITDTDNLFLAGKSQGAFASANAAIDVEEEIRAICLFSPAFCIPDDFRSGKVMFATFDVNNVPDYIEMFPGFAVGKGMIEEGLAMDVFSYFPVIEKDVLIIHGDSDSIVNVSYSEKMAELYPHAELIIIKGADHGFVGDDELKALDDMVKFFEAHLQ